MNVKRIAAILLALCMMLSLCACGGNQEESKNPENDQPAVEAPQEETEAPTDAPEEPEETEASGIVYTVTVQDEGGNPVVGAMVQVCQGELCLMPVATDADGVAVFTVAEEAEYEAKFLMLPEGYDYTDDEHVYPFGGSKELTITLKAVA